MAIQIGPAAGDGGASRPDAAAAAMLLLHEVTTRPQAAARVAALLRDGAGRQRDQRGHPFALWAPQIGGGMNALTLLTAWPREAPPPAEGLDWLDGIPEIAHLRRRILDPLARGERQPPPGDGICTIRWFLLPPAAMPELVRLSVEAWEGFEDDSPAQVLGLWDCRDRRSPDVAEVMMATHYPSLAVWEATRFWKPAGAEAGSQRSRAAWSALFRRRRALLLDSWVTVQGPPPAGD